jgi:MFS family permease
VCGSVVAALSTELVPLLVGRALQGTGMGVIPLGIAMIRDVLPPHHLGSAIALVSATLGVGGAVSLPLSAFVAQNYDWHALFWMAAIISAVALVLYIRFIPPVQAQGNGQFDYLGAIGLTVGLVGVLLGLARGNEWGWLAPPTLACVVGGTVVLLAWGTYQWRTSSPLVDLRVSARPRVLITNLASVAMGFALFASVIVYPQLLELPQDTGGLGLPLVQAGLILMPSGLAMLAMSPVAGWVERRVGAKPLLIAGACVIGSSYVVAVIADLDVWLVLILNTAIGVGIGLGYAAMPTLIMQAVPRSETGAANGLNTLMRSLGTSLAAAVIAAVLASSAPVSGGAVAPSPEGYQAALLAGLAAAAACAILAVFIPPARIPPDESPALAGEEL